MKITGNPSFLLQMRSPVLNRLSQLNPNPSANKHNILGMKEIRDKLHNMRVDVLAISSENTGTAGEDLEKSAKLTLEEMLAEYLPGGAKHELRLNEAVRDAFRHASSRIDLFEKCKEYLTMSEEHTALSQSTGLTDVERAFHARVADEIKRYVAQEASGYAEIQTPKYSSDKGYISVIDEWTGGAIGRLVTPAKGDLSIKALGLDGLMDNYSDLSCGKLKDMLSAAQEKIKPAIDRLSTLYKERTGKEPRSKAVYPQHIPFTAETWKQGEWDLFHDMRWREGFSDFVSELTLINFGEVSMQPWTEVPTLREIPIRPW